MIAYVLAATCISSVGAALLATIIGTKRLKRFARPLSLIATGLLITLSFTHVLPHAMEGDAPLHSIGLTAWATVMVLIALEMFLNTFHHHGHDSTLPHQAMAQGGSGLLSGTALHTFCDGFMIASAIMVDPHLGLAVTIAIMAHEIPQQLGDYIILLECGMSTLAAYVVNIIALVFTTAGGLMAYFILDKVENLLPYALAISASSFIYVSLSDLLPRLNKSDSKKTMLKRYVFLLTGAAIAMLISHHPH
ncbi:ZIP family metal transporter [Anaerobiospirillum thomasii]|uniref:Zinc transporter ZupT n=1 Tax=Anaerobiospirillum thomasii TaxID=179995 RepID=A0A2X0VQ08_9GAMM|nr:ZIP family metal transporter [Anaerobiospirillum thomasii]SPT69830.1 zinc transporter ZupT [Anaerobiospirillum thomasii]